MRKEELIRLVEILDHAEFEIFEFKDESARIHGDIDLTVYPQNTKNITFNSKLTEALSPAGYDILKYDFIIECGKIDLTLRRVPIKNKDKKTTRVKNTFLSSFKDTLRNS